MIGEGLKFQGYPGTTWSRKVQPRPSMREICLLLCGVFDQYRPNTPEEVKM